jgi:hypothetical protein
MGEPLKEREDELRTLVTEMGEVTPIAAVGEPVSFDPARTLSFQDTQEILKHLMALLEIRNTPFLYRAAASVEFVDLVAVSSVTADSRFRYWQGLRDGLLTRFSGQPLVSPSPPSGVERLFFRQAAFALGSVSNPAALRANSLQKLRLRGSQVFHGLRYVLGWGSLGHANHPEAVERIARREETKKGTGPDPILLRFLRNQLETHAHFADPYMKNSWLEGFQVLTMALPFAIWFARAASRDGSPDFPAQVEGVVRLADAMSTPAVFSRLGSGVSGWILRRPQAWLKLVAWATGTEPGDPLQIRGLAPIR